MIRIITGQYQGQLFEDLLEFKSYVFGKQYTDWDVDEEEHEITIGYNVTETFQYVEVAEEAHADEFFIRNNFGYCYYSSQPIPLIYNLYVNPEHRRQGHGRHLVELAIAELQRLGISEPIYVQVNPREGSISVELATKFYKSVGLHVME